jgi:endonuclease/exonuclease/phosphatase family metal-dependent hydrolase
MTNNYTPIAFKTAKFDLVASGAQRIIPCRPHEEVTNEETQETTVIYENTVQTKYGWPGYTITWAVLKDKTTGDTFAVTSLHNSTSSDTEGIEAKAKCFKEIVMPLVEKIAADNKCPVFMTGDYNSPVTTADIADTLLGGERKIVNSMDKAVRGHAEGSSHGPKGVLTVNTKGKAIDHIFMTGEATVVRHRYGLSQVTSDASDHRPVMIDVVI